MVGTGSTTTTTAECSAHWISQLYATFDLLQSQVDRLIECRNHLLIGPSTKIDDQRTINDVREQEGKVVKLFSKILYLKEVNDFSSNKIDVEDLEKIGNLECWLNITNVAVDKVKFLQDEVYGVVDLLKFNETDLETLCDKCGFTTEEKRKFVRATLNLRVYTKNWLGNNKEPSDKFTNLDLSWNSYVKDTAPGSTVHFISASSVQPPVPAESRTSPILRPTAGHQVDRRSLSISESGVDSGASDSGVGSNMSQNSLPTQTPPSSPGYFLTSSSVGQSPMSTSSSSTFTTQRGAGANAPFLGLSDPLRSRPYRQPPPTLMGTVLRGVTPPASPSYASTIQSHYATSSLTAVKSPTTPPPSSKKQRNPIGGLTGVGGVDTMTRSKSHESNLQFRLPRLAADPAPPRTAPPVVDEDLQGTSKSGAKHFDLSLSASTTTPSGNSSGVRKSISFLEDSGGGAMKKMAGVRIGGGSIAAANTDLSNSTASLFHQSYTSSVTGSSTDQPLKSPFALTGSSTTTDTLPVPLPKSPRGQLRMDHKIRHRFTRIWKYSRENCLHCNKTVGLSGEKCTECKIKVHIGCKEFVDDTCGLSTAQKRQIYDYFLNSIGQSTQGKRSPSSDTTLSPSPIMISSYPLPGFQVPPGIVDSASSSSCNSSAPSTPAPAGYTQSSVSPNVVQTSYSTMKSKFTFPDPTSPPEVPYIHVDESEAYNDVRASQSSGDATTIHDSCDGGSVKNLTNSETRLSPENVLQDSLGSNDSSHSGGHQWQRNKWTMSTIRGASSSWHEWTISFEEIEFTKDSLLGRGRFGEVHRAYWHQDVAIKFLNMDHVVHERQLETFKQEVKTFRNTRHENLVLFVGCCLNPMHLGIVMNLCKGQTLYTMIHLRRERFDMNKLIFMAIQLAQGMSYLHEKKITHKDLRTKNIFVENNNKVVITDFSLFSVRRLCTSSIGDREFKGLCTPEHWLCYLAPELARTLKTWEKVADIEEPPFSEMSDVYSFGTVWYELLTFEFPYKKQPTDAILWQCCKGIKPALNNLPVAKEIKDVLMQCWMYKAQDRPNFHQLLKTFEKLPKKRLERSPSQPVHLSRSAESMF